MGLPTDCDVLIVGGGPTGASLALLLARQQVRVIVVDKDADIYPLPRAAHVDHEIMRIFQSLGVADEVMATSRPVARYDFLNADRKILLRFDNGDHPGPGGWPVSNMIHQPSVERCLRKRIAQEPRIDFRTQWRFESHHESDGNIHAVFSTPGGKQALTARFLIGADGTRSPVRESAGIELEDLQFDEPWLVIDMIVHDASRLPDANLQICDPARPTTCVLMGNGRHRWEFMIRPDESPDDLLDDEVIEELLAPWNVQGSVTLERKAVYRFNARVAKNWRKGSVLLAGDAAHQMPPFAGQGMCSGQRDAANLAWKLGAVLRGAPAALLDDYQSEREPNVRVIIDTSIMMGRTVCITDPAAAAERDAGMLAANPAESAPLQIPPYPPINTGCILEKTRGAGSYFPQSPGAGHQRLDDVLGGGPWLICRSVQDSDRTNVSDIDLKVISLEDAELASYRNRLSAWLDEHDVDAVLVRPDRYVFGTGVGAELLSAWESKTKADLKNEVEKKEVLRKKSLGELGELFGIKALVDHSYEKVTNLNDKKMNHPYADLYAEKENRKYIISIKARNKYQKNRSLNAHYNLGNSAYKNARTAEIEYGAEAYWMAVQFDELTYSIYFGSLHELNQRNAIPVRECEKGTVGMCLVKDKRHYFDFGFFGNKKDK